MLACLAALPAVPAKAAAASPEEITFWQSVSVNNDPVELRAYLNAYPNGAFAAIAKSRLALLAPATRLRPDQPLLAAPAPAPVAAPAVMGALARLVPVRPRFRLVDGVTLDLDASAVRQASNLRLTVVPAAAPVAITDPDRLVLDSTAVSATHLHLTIPSGPPGADEIRLYYIPNTGTQYQLAARASVTIEPGVPGATLVRDLGREAAQLGPVRFEANHRDRPMLIQGAFLNLRAQTEWNVQWFAGMTPKEVGQQIVVMTIGQPNAAPDLYGSRGEAVCVMAVPNAATLNFVSTLNVGDPVLVAAIPSTWSNGHAGDSIVLQRCTLKP